MLALTDRASAGVTARVLDGSLAFGSPALVWLVVGDGDSLTWRKSALVL